MVVVEPKGKTLGKVFIIVKSRRDHLKFWGKTNGVAGGSDGKINF
jgi:hypothetical protein